MMQLAWKQGGEEKKAEQESTRAVDAASVEATSAVGVGIRTHLQRRYQRFRLGRTAVRWARLERQEQESGGGVGRVEAVKKRRSTGTLEVSQQTATTTPGAPTGQGAGTDS
uniref:Uncharacterized protein n=1 Tax=Arundo donax TaxID=35708 RepID=A0A0A8Z5M2_ARUDO